MSGTGGTQEGDSVPGGRVGRRFRRGCGLCNSVLCGVTCLCLNGPTSTRSTLRRVFVGLLSEALPFGGTRRRGT